MYKKLEIYKSDMKYKARTLSLLLFAVSWSPAMAADPVLLEAGRGVYRLGPNLEILTDLEGKLTIDQITSGNYTSSFYGYGWDRVPNFGYSSATFWVRCRITNPLPFQKEVLLELANPLLDEARLFFVDEGASSRTITESKSIKHRVYIFPVHVRPHETVDLYLRVKSKGSIALPLTLFRPDAFAREDQDTQFALGIYYGLIAVMILYNLTLFIALRERAYLYYSLALFCIHGMLQFAVNG
ncbi:MAG TPA: 7TM-DISM domain-containing protein, partial [Leptospiraceae bacterium]|nr:7TM-DISM domain-containing protein [Leptospiraceae bacterium]HNN74094.1 7TM-DISM domain-containing protein [Leptospiraceae bacterium]HQI18745.1 7TM-DISM domain-containing protein [Leptospiraceae bacterium]